MAVAGLQIPVQQSAFAVQLAPDAPQLHTPEVAQVWPVQQGSEALHNWPLPAQFKGTQVAVAALQV